MYGPAYSWYSVYVEKTIQARIYRSDSERLYQIGVAIAAQRDGKVPSVADVVHELIEREVERGSE